VASPEAAAQIVWRDAQRAKDMAMAMRITAQDLLGFKVIEEIVPEPPGGAHRHPEKAIAEVGARIAAALDALAPLDAAALRRQKRERFYAIGRMEAAAEA
jgi:acetyl-CoA carboxylase carboxyl transferase subunit alpha